VLYCYFHGSGIPEYCLVLVIYDKLQIHLVCTTTKTFILCLVFSQKVVLTISHIIMSTLAVSASDPDFSHYYGMFGRAPSNSDFL
jgi:hypothetical protein